MKKVTLDAQELCHLTQTASLSSGLSLYLRNLNRGREMTPRSWLYEKVNAQKVLERWIPIMEAANNMTKFGEEFNSFDLAQVEKFGPQGGIPSVNSKECWDVIEPLYSSSEYNSARRLEEWFPLADEFAHELFGNKVLRLRPMPPESVVQDMARRDTLTTNSGYPRFTRRFKTKEEEIDDAKTLKAFLYPAIVLFRYYHGKLRPVWMFPMSDNLIEAGFALQIQDCIAHSPLEWVRDYCTPWLGFDHVKSVLTKQWPHEAAIVGGDTTKMDAHMRPAQMQLVYEIVKWLFQRSYWPLLKRSLLHVNDIDLLYGLEEGSSKVVKLEGVHGLASGSSWTQLAETVLQLFIAYTQKVQGQGIGDDFYWVSTLDAEALVSLLGEFGLPANPQKQSVATTELTFLQRYFHQGFTSKENPTVFGAYYPTIRALSSMLYPENRHKVWNSDLFCIRNFMILENCVDDPCFGEFVRFVVRGHRDMKPFAKKKASELDKLGKEARSVPGLTPSYNQEKRDKPLSSFLSIALASQL